MRKSELLQWLEQQEQQWQTLLAEIGPERMEQPGVNGNWSMKDIVAHLTGWNQRLIDRLQAAQRGEAEPPPAWPVNLQSDDEINAWIYDHYQRRSLREVLDEAQQSYQRLNAVVEALPDDVRVEIVEPAFHLVWVGDQRYVTDEFYHHFQDDHEADVRAWLAQSEVGTSS